jgi:hypothetical protein
MWLQEGIAMALRLWREWSNEDYGKGHYRKMAKIHWSKLSIVADEVKISSSVFR